MPEEIIQAPAIIQKHEKDPITIRKNSPIVIRPLFFLTIFLDFKKNS